MSLRQRISQKVAAYRARVLQRQRYGAVDIAMEVVAIVASLLLVFPIIGQRVITMSRLPADGWEAAFTERLLEAAHTGPLSVPYEDGSSVVFRPASSIAFDGLRIAGGTVETDTGQYPFYVLLRELPFGLGYLFDDRFRLEPERAEIAAPYLLFRYDVTWDDGGVTAVRRVQWLAVLCFVCVVVLCIRAAVQLRRRIRSTRTP